MENQEMKVDPNDHKKESDIIKAIKTVGGGLATVVVIAATILTKTKSNKK